MNGIEAALEGRLGKNPELRQSQQGQPWLPLNVAVGEGDAVQWVGVAGPMNAAQSTNQNKQ